GLVSRRTSAASPTPGSAPAPPAPRCSSRSRPCTPCPSQPRLPSVLRAQGISPGHALPCPMDQVALGVMHPDRAHRDGVRTAQVDLPRALRAASEAPLLPPEPHDLLRARGGHVVVVVHVIPGVPHAAALQHARPEGRQSEPGAHAARSSAAYIA